jgi:hypothetical protein
MRPHNRIPLRPLRSQRLGCCLSLTPKRPDNEETMKAGPPGENTRRSGLAAVAAQRRLLRLEETRPC